MNFNYGKHRAWSENLSIVLQLGLTMAGSILFCFVGGRYLDRWLGLKGLFTILLTLFGIGGGAVVVYRQIMEVIAPMADSEKPASDAIPNNPKNVPPSGGDHRDGV